MLPEARLTHRAPGRVRLRVSTRKGSEEYFGQVRKTLAGLDGVTEVTTNARTAGVLVLYQGSPPDLEDVGMRENLFRLSSEQLTPQPAALRTSVRQRIQDLDRRILDFTNGQLDSQSVMFVGLAGLALMQALRGRVLPAGFNLLWRAFQLLPESAESAVIEASFDEHDV